MEWPWKTIKERITQSKKREQAKIVAFERLRLLESIQESKSEYFNTILVDFFSNYFHLRYAWTLEELQAELANHKLKNDIKLKIKNYIEELNALKYQPKGEGTKDLKTLADELSEIICSLP